MSRSTKKGPYVDAKLQLKVAGALLDLALREMLYMDNGVGKKAVVLFLKKEKKMNKSIVEKSIIKKTGFQMAIDKKRIG